MNLKNIIAAIVIIFAMGIVYLAFYGLFAGVTIEEKKAGPYIFVYDTFTGPYKDAHHVADRIYKQLLKEHKIDTYRGMGIYYDKPGEVEESKLRSISGCMLEKENHGKMGNLRNKFKVGTLPEGTYVTVTFPYKGMASIMLGVMKVYPKLGAYLAEKGYKGTPVMEIYDVPNRKLYYVVGVDISGDVYQSFLK